MRGCQVLTEFELLSRSWCSTGEAGAQPESQSYSHSLNVAFAACFPGGGPDSKRYFVYPDFPG